MSHSSLPLKTRVRYEGRFQTFDRRAKLGADLEKLPDRIWSTIGIAMLKKNLPRPNSSTGPAWK
jgi:hypothetical protein